MKYSFHPDAEIEFNISIDYYEECQANLGLEFANEVYKIIYEGKNPLNSLKDLLN